MTFNDIACIFSCTISCSVTIYMIIMFTRRSAELKKARERIEKLEKFYIGMAHELLNMTDAILLTDRAGVTIFYNKLVKLYEQFMAVGVDETQKSTVGKV